MIQKRLRATGSMVATTKALLVERLDELRKRSLPRLLTVVVDLREFGGVQAQLARHLHGCMRQAMPLSCSYPSLELPIGFLLGYGQNSASSSWWRTSLSYSTMRSRRWSSSGLPSSGPRE